MDEQQTGQEEENISTNDYDGLTCTCTITCGPICHGECGCAACSAAYGDFLSCDYD